MPVRMMFAALDSSALLHHPTLPPPTVELLIRAEAKLVVGPLGYVVLVSQDQHGILVERLKYQPPGPNNCTSCTLEKLPPMSRDEPLAASCGCPVSVGDHPLGLVPVSVVMLVLIEPLLSVESFTTMVSGNCEICSQYCMPLVRFTLPVLTMGLLTPNTTWLRASVVLAICNST